MRISIVPKDRTGPNKIGKIGEKKKYIPTYMSNSRNANLSDYSILIGIQPKVIK
jgi:hypothetical protein